MKTLMTIVSLVTMPLVVSGQGEHDLRLRLCLDGRAQAVFQERPPLRASKDGVVICATDGDDVENTKIAIFIDDVLDTFLINGRRLTQGVIADSIIFFCVLNSESSVTEYDLSTRKMRYYQHDSSGAGRHPVLISCFGSNIVALDLLKGPMIVDRDRQILSMVSDRNYLEASDVFGIRDSIFVLGYSGSISISLNSYKHEGLCPPVANERSHVSIVGDSAKWIDRYGAIWSFSRATKNLDSSTLFSERKSFYLSAVGKHGILTATRNEVDSTTDELVISYYSFDKRVVQQYSVLGCRDWLCYRDFDGMGWSNGTFYLTVGSPDSMMCIYSYEEPMPVSSSVEEDAKEPPASHDTSVVMSLHEFDAWRRELNSSYEMYDLYGNNITTSAVGVGVVFVVFDDHHTRVLVVP
jgi:hypothetical protein